MLKVLRQYYPVRNFLFFVGESIFIVLSILLATWVISGFSLAAVSETYLPKVLLVGLVLQTCLYYSDLYEFKERFEKLPSLVIFGIRRNFLKSFARMRLLASHYRAQVPQVRLLGAPVFAPKWAPALELPAYTGILDRIFIPLPTLKAACRNQISNWFLMMVVNLGLLARPCR